MEHSHRTQPTNDSTTAVASREGDPGETWAPSRTAWTSRVEPGFIVKSWLLCIALSLAIAAVATAIIAMLSQRPITGETNTELGVLTIVAGASTFIGFAITMSMRLTHVAHDRLTNSAGVGLLHTAFAIVVFAVSLILQATVDGGPSSIFEGPWTDELGNAFTVLERSAAAAILACVLAVGMVPARGDRPSGTQTAPTSQDEQL